MYLVSSPCSTSSYDHHERDRAPCRRQYDDVATLSSDQLREPSSHTQPCQAHCATSYTAGETWIRLRVIPDEPIELRAR